MHSYDGDYFFRVLPGSSCNGASNGDPKVSKDWSQLTISDNPQKESNKRGTITFATSGPNSRTTQVFINLNDNPRVDEIGFTPFGALASFLSETQQESSPERSFWRSTPLEGASLKRDEIQFSDRDLRDRAHQGG
jgi:cyclophilin family peptidyl-prolyl cis-trans isomerase